LTPLSKSPWTICAMIVLVCSLMPELEYHLFSGEGDPFFFILVQKILS
jgi:hypothetical protein